MIDFYIINTYDYTYYTVSSVICRVEKIEGDFNYSFRICKGYLKKHISKNFAALAFKKKADLNTNTKDRVPIKELIDALYVHLSAQEDIDPSSLHHSIRKL